MTKRIRALCGLFLVSGFCGLIYESIWSHYLKLFLGHAAYAQTVVLVVFIGGMALGAWLAGRWASRIRRPLIAYAAAELLVGVAALLFHGVFTRSTDWAYAHLLPALCSSDGWCWAQWAFAAVLILPQSILLGATFPLMSGGILRLDPALPGSRLALLYFLNSLGAVAGVLASGFLLIPAVGLPGALVTAGIFNVVLSIAVYALDKGTSPSVSLAHVPGAADGASRPALVRLMLAVALLTGLSSFIYEIAWIRSLSLVLGASTHSFELMLASFILGLALGGLWIRKRIDRIPDSLRFLAIVQVVMGLLAVATLPVYDATFDLMAWAFSAIKRSEGGWLLFNASSTIICLVVMLPATFAAGMTLPLITARLLGTSLGERSIGQVYAANTLGGILGVIIAVHLGLPLLGLKGTLVLGGAIDVALGIALMVYAGGAKRRGTIGWSTAGIAGLAIALAFFHIDPLRLVSSVFRGGDARASAAHEVLYHRDGKTASVDVLRHQPAGFVAIATNGKVDGSVSLRPEEIGPGTDEYTMAMMGAVPLAHRPDAKVAAVIGFGTGITTATLLAYPGLERVDTIEIEPAMLEGAKLFGAANSAAYTDPRSHLVVDDAKSYFARARTRYDIIVSEPSNPWVSGVSSLFTHEFYRRVHGQLNERGLLVQWIHYYAFDEALLESILLALQESFPHYVIYAPNNGDLVIVSSAHGPVPPLDAAIFRAPRLAASLDRLEIRTLEDLRMRRIGDEGTAAVLFRSVLTQVNSDYFPFVDTHASKALFLNTAAPQLRDLSSATWPIIEMMGGDVKRVPYPITLAKWGAGERLKDAIRAEHARRYILGGLAEPEAVEDLGPAYAAVSLFKALLVDCGGSGAPHPPWDAVVTTASLLGVYLPPEVSAATWQRIEKGSCLARLDADRREWIALFKAVGARDAPAMAARAEHLLAAESQRTPVELEYLYGAALLGRVASGDREAARGVIAHHGDKIPQDRRDGAELRTLQTFARMSAP